MAEQISYKVFGVWNAFGIPAYLNRFKAKVETIPGKYSIYILEEGGNVRLSLELAMAKDEECIFQVSLDEKVPLEMREEIKKIAERSRPDHINTKTGEFDYVLN